MQITHERIREKVKDKSYFSDAKEWYAQKYLMPITERSYTLVLMAITAYLLLSLLVNIQALYTENPKLPFPHYTENSTDYFLHIKPLIKHGETPHIAVAKYLLGDYVQTRESYVHKNMTPQHTKNILKKIKISSTKPVYNEYQNYMSKTNPHSPFVRYKDKTNRLITIQSVTFFDNDVYSGKAELFFKANEVSADKSPSSKWKATVYFRLPDVEMVSGNDVPLRFLVTYYKVRPIN